MPTAAGADASTLDRGRARVHAIDISFDDETQARPVDNHLLHKLRDDVAKADADLGIDYESLPSLEVRRPYDTYEKGFPERDPVTQARDPRVHESARVRRSDDREASYEEPSYEERAYREPEAENDPGHPDYWGRREESGPRERPVAPIASYAAPAPSYDDASDSARWGRDRAQPTGWSSMPPHANDSYSSPPEPMIPPAPRVPDEMRPAFVVGVQPIRTATPDAWGTPRAMTPVPGQYQPSPAQAMQSSMPAQYNQAQHPYAHQAHQAYAQPQYSQPAAAPARAMTAYPAPTTYLQPGQRHPTPAPMHQSGMGASMMQRAQPVGGQLTQPPASPKVGRFACFVAGAAFGITFAFFATGFFNGAKAKEDVPAAPAVQVTAPAVQVTAPAATQAAPVAPAAPAAQVVAPAAPTAALAPVAPPAISPGALPAAPPTAAAPAAVGAVPPVAAPTFAPVAAAPVTGVAAVAPPAPPPARPAPPPRAPRAQAPRRPAAPPSMAPKNLGGGGPGADDGPSAPPAPPPGAELGDLLGAGLKP